MGVALPASCVSTGKPNTSLPQPAFYSTPVGLPIARFTSRILLYFYLAGPVGKVCEKLVSPISDFRCGIAQFRTAAS